MHVVVSWDISARQPQWNAINDQMLAVLAPFPWIRPLNTFYLVQINDLQTRLSVINALNDVSQRSPVQVLFAVGPLSTGQYGGRIGSADDWPAINAITT